MDLMPFIHRIECTWLCNANTDVRVFECILECSWSSVSVMAGPMRRLFAKV